METNSHAAGEASGGNEAFVHMWNAGRELDEIASRFSISRKAVITRAAKLRRTGTELVRRSPRPDSENGQMRRCLGCGRSFMSAHVGNRLCWSCSDDEAMGGLI